MDAATPHDTFDSFTVAAKRVLSDAQLEAQSRHQTYVGQEHLLLGLLQSPCAGAGAIEACEKQIRMRASGCQRRHT